MLDCLIIGDSIAVGTAMQRPDCQSIAKGGINSWQWNKDYSGKLVPAKTVIISLGSNDHKGVKSIKELLSIRENIKDSRVYWILPTINSQGREAVTLVAEQYGDIVLPITRTQVDKIHPSWAGYKELGEKAK
jgi:lysophospholipase L1-like esterase